MKCNDFNVDDYATQKNTSLYHFSEPGRDENNEHFHPLLMRYSNTRGTAIAQLFLFAGKTVFPMKHSSTKT